MTTFATLRRECRKLGMIARRTEWDEYCVAFPAEYQLGLRQALDMVDCVEPLCALEAIESDESSIRWIWRRYGRVISETRAIHFPEAVSPATARRIAKLLN